MGFLHRAKFAGSMVVSARSELRMGPWGRSLLLDGLVLSGKNEGCHSCSPHQTGAMTLWYWVSLPVTHIQGQSSLTDRHTVEVGRFTGV